MERGADGPGDGRQQAKAIRERRVPALARRRRRGQREFENFDAPLASTPRLAQLEVATEECVCCIPYSIMYG